MNKNIPVSEVSGGGGGARWEYPAHQSHIAGIIDCRFFCVCSIILFKVSKFIADQLMLLHQIFLLYLASMTRYL